MSWLEDAWKEIKKLSNPLTILDIFFSAFEAETEAADIARMEALTKEQIAVMREKLALEEKMWETELGLSREDMRSIHTQLTPYREAGTDALGKMLDLMENPDSLADTGTYKFLMEEGARARNMRAIATGDTGGALDRELTRFGQGLASQEYGAEWNRLSGLANLGRGAVTPEGGPGAGLEAEVGAGAEEEDPGEEEETRKSAYDAVQGPGESIQPAPEDFWDVGGERPDITNTFWGGLPWDDFRDFAENFIPWMEDKPYPVVSFWDDPLGWYTGKPTDEPQLDSGLTGPTPGVPEAPALDPGLLGPSPGTPDVTAPATYGRPALDTKPEVPQISTPTTYGTPTLDTKPSVPQISIPSNTPQLDPGLLGPSPGISMPTNIGLTYGPGGEITGGTINYPDIPDSISIPDADEFGYGEFDYGGFNF